MRRVVFVGSNHYQMDYQRRDIAQVFAETGANTGNQAITFGLASMLEPGITFLPWTASAAAMREAGDILVVPMANHLGNHTDQSWLAERLEEIGLPVIGLGLGAQAPSNVDDIQLTAGTRRWLETLVRLAPSDAHPSLGLRGAYTAEQMTRLGFEHAGVVTGCPSNFINKDSDFAARVKAGFSRRPASIAVTAGIPYTPSLTAIERDLADIVTMTGGAYIVQHGINMIQIARNQFDTMDQQHLEDCRAYIMPDKSRSEFIRWCRQYAHAFFDVPAWMDFLRRFDFVVGSRLHGVMLAIQAGVPAGCITHDSRTTELCQTMGIPYCHCSDINGPLTRRNVMDYFTFDLERYSDLRQTHRKRFLDIFASADIAYNRELDTLA